jgi:class 3 adenylate cyclase/tetratricopeptide (TPR) repeat protein
VITCARCGREAPEDASFCAGCGTPLTTAPAAREERKVVTILFADLVGFTERSERLDPEDVRATLSGFHAHVRTELERFGGTVEKFIGDAVMAVFGAPVAHEDDPERAVRAALAIRDWAVEQDGLQVRIAVNTGEALVSAGNSAEGMVAGDPVNTAARLQSAAPVNGVLVGEQTYRATERTIEYRHHEGVTAKGKAEPVPVWEAVEPRARAGVDVRQLSRAPLVGREKELAALRADLARARDGAAQLVTLVGEPGIGKSRLVYELFQEVDASPEFTIWRQGRSLPYGEGVTFWALSEMVKSQAGILETDTLEDAERKLAEAVPDEWVCSHLRPLVGLATEREPERTEAFAAWRRFFETLAGEYPLVLVFEDLHWADDVLLDFVDYLVDWAGGVPLLVVCTARPELLARRPGWAGGKANATTLSIAPLTDDETARLVHDLVERTVIPADVRSSLLERAGGNPLYTEEFVRMLAQRDDRELVLPESVQGLIAARLDELPPEEKALLQTAAVIGKVFWLGAVAGSEPRWTVEQLLHALERKEFIRRERLSSVAGETEFAFRHQLVRDVAYSGIVRAERVAQHDRAAQWIEGLGRPADHAELLAHHYLSALDLARAAGRDTSEFEDRARIALSTAGDRAAALGAFEGANRFYAAALELWDEADPERPYFLFRYGKSLRLAEGNRVRDVLLEARDGLVELGDRATAAEAETILVHYFQQAGRHDLVESHLEAAATLVADAPTGRAKALVLCALARTQMLVGRHAEALELGREALALAEELDLDEGRSHALNTLGVARVALGDAGGVADLERSLEIALAANSPLEIARAYNNLGTVHGLLGDPERAWEANEHAIEVGYGFGAARIIRWGLANRVGEHFGSGRWDDALRDIDEFVALDPDTPHALTPLSLGWRALIRLARGEIDGALEDLEVAVDLSRDGNPSHHAQVLSTLAFALTDLGRADEAAAIIDGLFATHGRSRFPAEAFTTRLALTCARLGKSEDFAAAVDLTTEIPLSEPTRLYVTGDLAGAAAHLDELRARPDAALIRMESTDPAELGRAIAFWRSVGATRYLSGTETALAATA